MNRTVLRLSVTANVFLIAAAIFFCIKRFRFQHQLIADRQRHSYLDNPQYAEQMSIQSVYHRQANIVILGDSHVYKAEWPDLLNRPDVTARGIGSDMTDGYLSRIDQVLQIHPKVVFIEGGANDLWYERPVDTIIEHLRLLLNELEAEHISVILHTLPPNARWADNADDYNEKVRILNRAIIELCGHTGTPYIDLYDLTEKDGYMRPGYAQADGVHLTGEAYKAWAAAITKILHQLPNL